MPGNEDSPTLAQGAAMLARIDERSINLLKAVENIGTEINKARVDINGIGNRVSTAEALIDNHKWFLRTLAGAVITIATGLAIWFITTR